MHLPYKRSSATNDSEQKPLYHDVIAWVVLLPLLLVTGNGGLSFLNPYSSTLMTEKGALLKTDQGMRPQVILYFAAMILFTLVGHREIWRVLKKNKLILAGIAYAGLSCLWSSVPALSLRTTFELTLTTCFAAYLFTRFSPERLMSLLMFAGVVASILGIAMVIFFPQYGIFARYEGGAWQGIYSHKNTLGVSSAFLLTPAFYSQQPRFLRIAYGALMLFMIAMSQSRGAWFVALGVIVFAVWLHLYRRLKRPDGLLLLVCSGALIVGALCLALTNLGPLMTAIGKDPTLTGRTGIYSAVVASIQKKPLLGYGFGAFWNPANQESTSLALSIGWISIAYAENGILEIMLQIGLVGIGLVALLFWRAGSQTASLLRHFYTPRVGWYASMLFLELITNIEAGAVMTPASLNWTLTLISCMGLAAEIEAYRKSETRPVIIDAQEQYEERERYVPVPVP